MSYTYIPYIPKPLLNDFINNRVVPFVGAGFSKNADIPSGVSMPDWNELGEMAASEISEYDYDNSPIDALSYYESLYSRTKLIEFLMKSLHVGAIRPGDTYLEFCKLFTGTICTTNFDFLLEEAMSSLKRPISTIVTEDRLTVNSPNENRILKLHGDFNHPDKMVITELDYDMYLENNPVFATYVSNLFITNTMILIGYSLEDNDFRGIWQIINNRLGGMTQPAYCIVVGASQAKISRYNRRNIHVINLPGESKNYKRILHDLFFELNDYISKEKDKTAKSKDERINEQLLIPSDNNKLCFISCTMKRIAQLSSLLHPILHKCGVTPVRTDDMLIKPGENWLDVVGTIIRKSKLAIVDVSDDSPAVLAELSMLQSNKKKIKIICESGIELPTGLNEKNVLRYTFDDANGNNKIFEQQLVNWMDNSIEVKALKKDEKQSKYFENAYSLLDKKDYSACIVSAYSEFLYLIKNKTSIRPITFEHISNLAKDKVLASDLYQVRILRNQILHESYNATEDEAEYSLKTLSEIIANIQNQ